MQITKREFLKGMGLLGAAGMTGCAGLGRRLGGEPDVRFGVLSDVHLNKPGDEDTLEKAFAYFRDRGADGVVIAGDIADTSRIEQLQRCADAWYRVFPGDRGLGGRHVEKLFIYGNHECWGWYKDRDKIDLSQTIFGEGKEAEIWEKVFHEKYEPIWMKNVKGFSFIGGHWTRKDSVDIEAFMEAHGKEIDPTKPFFYIQHAHPKDTCIGPWAWGRDNGESTRALSKFPNAVAFSGHSHYPFSDERTIWQGAFTSINTSSLKYQSCDYSLRENLNGNGYGFHGENRKHLMTRPDTGRSRQGLLVSVYGSTLDIERRDFVQDLPMGDDWVISVPCGPEASFKARAARRSAPEFATDAKLSFSRDSEKKLLTVAFPPAQTVKKCRVYEYEITATLVEDEVELVRAQRRIMAPDYFLPEVPGGTPAECVFSIDELQAIGNYRFSVVPLDCFGLRGRPLSAGFDLREPEKSEG